MKSIQPRQILQAAERWPLCVVDPAGTVHKFHGGKTLCSGEPLDQTWIIRGTPQGLNRTNGCANCEWNS